MEILSPVGNEQMLTAAVRSGADAVYLGVKDFNARRNADNFDSDSLLDAVKYCHIRGVRVYLTLNTVLSDSEMERALFVAQKAYALGVDAVIVQDLGLAKLLCEKLPNLPLHASTQLTAHSPSALPLLKKLGFTQVVASREMTKQELIEFCAEAKRLSMSVEVFVHGALCMCMSGQCYLSAMLGGRSGNRGLCAGPCRLPFSAKGGNGYDLSLKDLSLVGRIEELREIGVSSLKIEGRMKTPEYVAAATAVCRRMVDGQGAGELLDTLQKIFSRSGFTDGYFNQKLGKEMFGVRTQEDAELSNAVKNSLHELYRNERQSVHITGSFCAESTDKPVRFCVSDGKNTVCLDGAVPSVAINRSLSDEIAASQLKKTGGTPFVFDSIETKIANGLSVSAGELNALRRKALEQLSNVRYTKREEIKTEITLEKNDKKEHKRDLVARFAEIKQIPNNLDGVAAVIVPLESDFDSVECEKPLCVDVPRGIENENYILTRLKKAKEKGIKAAFCGNIAAVTLCKEAGITPVFDFSMNVFNSHSTTTAKDLGAAAAVLSFEMTREQINNINTPLPVGMVGYGKLPLMLTRNCPLKNGIECKDCDKKGYVTDRLGIKFPVRCRMGYSELFNSRPLWLSERTDEFDVDFITLYFTDETKDECERVINDYKKQTSAKGEYTRGLYYRGVE